MAEIHRGRWTANVEGDFVVFLIGMRINRLRAVGEWLPVARAMGPMLRELVPDETSGLLGYRVFPGLRSVTLLQYWRSSEHLQTFANAEDRTHRPAWLAFFQRSWQGGAVGIWHETYVVPAGSYESIYGNMPLTGLAKATQLVPVRRLGESAGQRLSRPGRAEFSAPDGV